MTRDHFERPLRDGDGLLLVGASVRILDPATDLPISDPLYVGPTGPETRTNPWTTDTGVVDFYLDRSRIIKIGVVKEVGTAEVFFDNIEVGNVDLAREVLSFTIAGNVSVQTGNLRLYIEAEGAIERVRASVGTPPVGGPIVVDVLLNGVSIFGGGAKPTIADGGYTGYVDLPTPVEVVLGDYLTVDVTSVGSPTPGANLVTQIREARY